MPDVREAIIVRVVTSLDDVDPQAWDARVPGLGVDIVQGRNDADNYSFANIGHDLDMRVRGTFGNPLRTKK